MKPKVTTNNGNNNNHDNESATDRSTRTHEHTFQKIEFKHTDPIMS